jgi:plasmid stability protein
MAQILVRGLDDETVAQLKARARANNRSLQGEVKAILEESARMKGSLVAFQEVARKWQAHFEGRTMSESGDLIREDRER